MFTLKSLTIKAKIINIYNNFKTIEKITIIYNKLKIYNNMEEIRNLENVSFDEIFKAFSEAFNTYEVQINEDEFRNMLTRRSYSPKHSFAIFINKQIVSFILNGIGEYNNIKTAYDTGTGTISEYRGRRYTKKLFEYSLLHLKKDNIQQYLLEVLKHNTRAFNIYKNLGLKINREFAYFVKEIDEINISEKNKLDEYSIKEIEYSIIQEEFNKSDMLHSWQNNHQAISRNLKNFIFLELKSKDTHIGYSILEPKTGDISQLYIKKEYRRLGLGSKLLKATIQQNNYPSIKVINIDTRSVDIIKFLNANHIQESGKQYEMLMTL